MYAAYNVMLISILYSYCDVFGWLRSKLFADECVDDSDCGNKGSCIDIMATKFPKKQCFCNPGWFGEGCSRGKKINYKQQMHMHTIIIIYQWLFFLM